MSKVSKAIKEKRASRRDKRNESFNSQDNQSAADFDFNKHSEGRVGNSEVRHLRQQGNSREDIMSAAQESGAEIGGRAQNRFNRWSNAKERAQVNKPAVEPSNDEDGMAYAGGTPGFYDKGGPGNGAPGYTGTNPNDTPQTPLDQVHQEQNQNANQDNDVTSTITGDNNTVRIDQDNSIRQYGGINKSFVYNGSSNGNNYEDTPVSAGTMGGYFHDEDSPGRSASFVDRYTTMNSDYQKQFKNQGHAQSAIDGANRNQAVNIGALDQKINDRAAATRARSTVMAGDIFGDMFNYKPEDWKGANNESDD